MASTPNSFTFLSIVVLLSVLIRPSSSDTAALVKQICGQALSYGLCHRFFKNRVHSSTMDIIALSHIAVEESLSLIKSTNIVVRVLKAREHDKNIQNLYAICESSYEILTSLLESTNLSLNTGDYRNMMFYLEKCDRFVTDCESVIGSQVVRLNMRDMRARLLISISLSAAGILNGGH